LELKTLFFCNFKLTNLKLKTFLDRITGFSGLTGGAGWFGGLKI